VVLATVTHVNSEIYELRFVGQDEALRPTGTHRLYSEDRVDWALTRDLVPGETLRTASGTVTLESIRRLPGAERVFNIEVETEHTYFVSSAEVLSHNVCPEEPRAGVDPYEVGPHSELKDRSVPGDGLDLHHAGQAHAMKQIVPGYAPETGPSIALPRGEHVLIPNLRGPVRLTPRQLLARDIMNLRSYTNAPNSSLRRLIELNKSMYPRAFEK
jgi:hypothetical protein